MLWIKEVELVDSVDDLKSSCSVRGIRMPNIEVLDAKIASAPVCGHQRPRAHLPRLREAERQGNLGRFTWRGVLRTWRQGLNF